MFTLFVIVVLLPHHSHLTVEVFFPKKLSLLLGDVIYLCCHLFRGIWLYSKLQKNFQNKKPIQINPPPQ